MDKYIITNFAYGTGPYLRTTELALAFNDELENRGHSRMGIVVPWVYGEKQKKNMLEEPEIVSRAKEIFLDEKLGLLLKNVFYNGGKYKDSLRNWADNCKKVSNEAKTYLSGNLKVINLSDSLKKEINGKDIGIELNRSPRIRYDIAPAYSTTFGYISEIFKNSLLPPHSSKIDIDKDSYEMGVKMAEWVESGQKKHLLAYPGTFSWEDGYVSEYKKKNEHLVPPIIKFYSQDSSKNISQGIFTTVTGIPGLERLYKDVKRMLHQKIYTNDPTSLPEGFSILALPNIITNHAISFHVARAGWSSIWLSMLAEKPMIVPEFDPEDDPEIYFNNIAVEKIGIGVVYRNQEFKELVNIISKQLKKTREKSRGFVEKIKNHPEIKNWNKEDGGNNYCAKLIADDFLKNKSNSFKV